MKLRCLVVDDESLARKMCEDNIRQVPFLEWVRSCKNPFEAMEALQEEEIDLMFLDIQMPGMLGTQLLQGLKEKPMVIFVTAYSNYAVESYDLEVIDYLMKPVPLDRFTKAAYKALEVKKLRTQPQGAAVKEEKGDFMFINVEYALVRVNFKEINYIEGLKDYIKIHLTTTKRPLLTKSTLKAMEEKLPEGQFMRVHKSFIVSLEKIESIRNREIKIGEAEIPVSESLTDELMKALNMG